VPEAAAEAAFYRGPARGQQPQHEIAAPPKGKGEAESFLNHAEDRDF